MTRDKTGGRWLRRKPSGITGSILQSKKGQSTLISHSIAIAMTIFLILAVIVTFNSMRVNYQDFVSNYETKQVCLSIKAAAEEIYKPDNYTSLSNTTMARLRLDLPRKIADRNYYARLVNSSVYIRVDGLGMNRTCKIGFPATFNGSSDGGPTYVTWTRYANGTDRIEVQT